MEREKRIVYKVISCTSEENDKGIFHYSKSLSSLKEARSFADFVELCGKKEVELGEPVTIYASY